MFHQMRKQSRALSLKEAEEILQSASYGVLCVLGDDGYPYGVPVNHAYRAGKLYFHCAVEGHKLDALQRCDKVSFTAVTRDQLLPEQFTTDYESAIAFGRAHVLSDPEEKRAAIRFLLEKFTPASQLMAQGMDCMEKNMDRTALVEITVEHLTGKRH